DADEVLFQVATSLHARRKLKSHISDAPSPPPAGRILKSKSRHSASTGTKTVIDLYTWTTPNGRKASILLEELQLPYTAHPVDISKDEQFKPAFLKISPTNRSPAIVDRDTGISLMESAAHDLPRGQDRKAHAERG